MTARELFLDIDTRILGDAQPSCYFQILDDPIFENEHPFTMLSRLKGIKQSPQYHPEGSVWNHTMLVLDEAAARKEKASDSRAFMWAALLHDIGKAVTTKIRKDKITAYGHDKAGAEMAREFLAGFESEVFVGKVAALVRWHMQILYVTKSMRFADLDAMCRDADVLDVALLGLCDRLGRARVNRRAEGQTITEFIRKATDMKNNKNRIKDRDHSNPELRKMKPKENADVGIASGQKAGTHASGHEKNGRQKNLEV